MRSAIKYKDRHQNEVIFVTSDSYFFTLFLQKRRLSESSEFRSAHDISPYNPPFTFTGKEKDAETGSDLSGLFLSVDPMSNKYPNISPYAYCAWNPVKLVDPDGCEIGDYYTEKGKKIGSDGENDGKIYIVPFKEDQKKIKRGIFEFENKFELPSLEARQKMCNYLETEDEKDNLREYGGAIWENENDIQKQEIRAAIPGDRWNGVSPEASIATNEYGNDGFDATGKRPVTFFHSHFSGIINGVGLRQWPSGDDDGLQGDVQNVLRNGKRSCGARLPYNIMVAMRTKRVFLYTEKGVKCTIDLDIFKTIGK